LSDAHPSDLWGRSLIVHADEDDLGKGDFPDSATTGHSGKRIGCAIFGRGMCSVTSRRTTRKKA
jgi:Cu/Zn superoxide dismutase